MTSSKERQFLARLHRAKSSLSGVWSCRSGEDYISPSPRGRGQKKSERASRKREYEEIKASQSLRVQSDRLSLEGLSLELPREGHSKRTETDSSTPRDKINRQLQPTPHRHQDDFDPRGENVGNLESDAASGHIGLPKSGKGMEKAGTEVDTSNFEREPLQVVHNEVEQVMDKASSSMHHTPEEDSRPSKNGSWNPIDFGQNTKAVNVCAEGGFQDLRFEERQQNCPPTAYLQRGYSSNSEIEEVEVSNTLSKDSKILREEGRKAEGGNQLHRSVDGVPEEEVQSGIERSESPPDQYAESKKNSAMGKTSQNIVIANSGRSYNLEDAEGEKLKTLEQHESPVSVLSGALGSGRWADFDSANNTPYLRADSSSHEIEELKSASLGHQMVFSNFSDVAKPAKYIGARQPDSDNLQPTEDESLEASEGMAFHHLQHDFVTANGHASGKDATEGMGTLAGDFPAVFSEKGGAENETEPSPPLHDVPGTESDSGDFKPERSESLEQASQDGTEKTLQEELDPMVQNRKQKLDWKPAHNTGPSDGREGVFSDGEMEAQNPDNLQKVQGKKMQDGLHEELDGGLKAPQNDIFPKTEGLGGLPTGDGNSKSAAANDDGTHDPYRDVAGSTNLNGVTASGKDESASIYGAGPYLGYFVVGVAVVVAVSYLHYRRTLW